MHHSQKATKFITYSSLDDLQDRRKRSQIVAHVNTTRREHKIRTSTRSSRAPLEWDFRPSTQPVIKVEPDLPSDVALERHAIAEVKESDDADDRVVLSNVRPHLTSYTSVDGHRRDPFASFPVTQTGQVLWAADYFTHVYALQNASLYSDDQGNWLLRRLFSLALQSDMMFEALVLSMSRLHPASATAMVPGGLRFNQYRTSVLSKLHRRLANKEAATDDVVLHTIMALISADFFAGHDDHAATHLKGMQAIVTARGGLENGGFDHFTIYNLKGIQALCQFASQRLQQSATPRAKPEVTFAYPKQHPFAPQLCAMIATLPVGFSDIAISSRLSYQIINLLARLARAAQDSPLTVHASVTEINQMGVDFLSYISERTLTPLERSICILCFLFNIRDGLQSTRNKVQQLFGDFLGNLNKLLISTAETFMALEGCTEDLAVWGTGIFATVSTVDGLQLPEEECQKTFAALVRRYPRTATHWDQTEIRLKRFFFPEKWVEEYHHWWTKETATHTF